MVTALEVKIMDTLAFQRLHGIKQLGTTYLVYPCAVHTRFEHTLGCLYMTDKMINCININPVPVKIIDSYDKFILRLVALTHDIAHMPFGHTLESEGNLFKGQWQDEKRREKFIGENSDIYNAIVNDDTLNELDALGYHQYNPHNIMNELTSILIALEDHNIEKLEKPYLCDIVGDTLCADLLDYIKRDMFFLGLNEDYDDRLMAYLYIDEYTEKSCKKERLILRLNKPTSKMLRKDIQSDLLHIIRLRYSLAEKAYFHHVKISSSAMLISAVTDVLYKKAIDPNEFYDLTDELFLHLLKEKGTDCSKYLVENLLIRKIYKPVYGLKYFNGMNDEIEAVKKEIFDDLRCKEHRYIAERSLERANDLPEGSIVIYCPSFSMAYKEIKALVDYGQKDKIGPFYDVASDSVKKEIDIAIKDKHHALWAMYVFVHPDIPNEVKCCIHADCQKLFSNFNNGIIACRKYYDTESDDFKKRYSDRYSELHPTRSRNIREKNVSARGLSEENGIGNTGKYYIKSFEEYCKCKDIIDEK